MINENFLADCRKFLKPEQIILDAPMSEHTTFKIGGPADCLLKPSSLEETQKILQLVKEYDLPLTFVGNGSNMLVRDKGIRGVVVNFADNIDFVRVEGTRMTVGAGAIWKDVAEIAAQHSLAGVEFACGIPGSIGGAVFMNAGAYGGETKSVVKTVRAVTRDGEIKTYSLAELDLGYRHSIFQSNGEAIVEVELELTPGKEEDIRAGIADYTNRRESKQPLEMPSAGSTFKRPEGYFAGTLIDQTGLKGLTVGGAQVSTKHAGFVVNKGGATAADVVNLIHEVQKRVKEAHGVELQPEVRMIGEK
ncbi:UDP-N-acetylmuramate dehydrogenase [Selenomonas ruminantium]|uniref:UDP-N-acetylenolpyruvoylglucosamine reductase n=1 Tax=Selenomonas ruminantium TaxID=971 RepID=A0A1H0RWR6_SELRU|nr:UDP-N-acetylmuramate dehydrogenase [Selenomonas ruminantium]SDP33870.1 UDP-N-acetylmuramate dehydrogenase [Selenomonas ruminantium]